MSVKEVERKEEKEKKTEEERQDIRENDGKKRRKTGTLDEMREGEEGRIMELAFEGEKRKRMLDLGFSKGTLIRKLGKSPLGDPAAYRVRGTVIALRRGEEQKISVEKETEKKVETEENVWKIALIGNPNVGKSTLFNQLTGLHQHTGNWTGKTVEKAEGICRYHRKTFRITDLPGIYSLVPASEEEKAAEEYLSSGTADVIVVLCDGTCLLRNMNLVLQILERTEDVVVCINFMDEMKKKGIRADLPLLGKRLGVPVIGISAREQKQYDELFKAVERTAENRKKRREREAEDQKQDHGTEKRRENGKPAMEEDHYLKKAEEICKGAVFSEAADHDQKDRTLDRIFTGKRTGFPIMFLLLFFIFWLTICGANYASVWLNRGFQWLERRLLFYAEKAGMPDPCTDLLIFGVYRVVSWVIAVMLPPMAVFFPLFTFLEDAGYLPRIAFNLDRCFQCVNACGKQALTMAMGFGCNAAGVTGCRIISSERERLTAILTNTFTPCNGRFPILITLFLTDGRGGILQKAGDACFFTGISRK